MNRNQQPMVNPRRRVAPVKKNHRPRALTIIMLIILAVSLLLESACAYDLFVRTPVPASEATEERSEEELALIEENQQILEEQRAAESQNSAAGDISFIPRPAQQGQDLDTIVTDERSAMEALIAMESEIGIPNAQQEYRCVNHAHYDFGDSYTMQQYYNGVEVFGSTLKMSVNPSGAVTYVGGQYHPIANFSTDASISESDARDRLVRYLKSQYQIDNPSIDSEGKKIYLDNNAPVLCYEFHARESIIFIDATTGNVIVDASEVNDIDVAKTIVGTASDQEAWHSNGNRTVEVIEESAGKYVLASENRNIYVYDTHADDDSLFDSKNYNDYYRFSDTDTASLNRITNDAFANLEIVYDEFVRIFGRFGMKNDPNEQIRIYSYLSNYDNAACHSDEYIKIGDHTPEPNYSYYLDVLAHEYTHGIVYNSCKLSAGCDYRTTAQPLAINEGLADVFGEVVEYYHTGACNWITGPLTTRNAMKNDTVQVLSDFLSGKVEEHGATFLVSHPFYLMTQGIDGDDSKKIPMETMAHLYYRMIVNKLTQGASFKVMRAAVEKQALEMRADNYLNDKHIECVMDAMDKVEIPLSYKYALTPDAVIRFTDNNGAPFPDGELTIFKAGTTEVVLNAEKSNEKGEISLNNRVVPGIYDGIVKVSNGETERFTLAINDKANTNDPYKDKATVTLDSTYISVVLDVSGSMNGNPIDAAKSAAKSLVATVFRNAPWAKISLITYSSGAGKLVETSSNAVELNNAIDGIRADGGTNMYDGIDVGKTLLKKGLHKMLFVMSDGMPNQGKNESGDYVSPIISYANEIKGSGAKIFSFGFFHSLSGNDLTTAQSLMQQIASPNYYYNVSSPDDLNGAFTFIAGELADIGNTINIKVECPVDVSVTYNGQTLSSSAFSRNVSTDFGLLTFEGENNDTKILNLRAGPDYEVCLNGTGSGSMRYTIAYSDENGEYVDTRTFDNVPLTGETLITTSTSQASDTRMEVDNDGDGTVDLLYTADANGYARQTKSAAGILAIVIPIVAVLIVVQIAALLIYSTLKRRKKYRKCQFCGMPRQNDARFCMNCGRPLPDPAASRGVRKPQSAGAVIAKLVVILVCAAVVTTSALFYHSSATKVYKSVQTGRYSSAQMTYQRSVQGKTLQKGYLNLLTDAYLDRVDAMRDADKVSTRDAIPVWYAVSGLRVGGASDHADQALLEQGQTTQPDEAEQTPAESLSGLFFGF